MRTAISILCTVACVSAIQVGYVAPAASSYVYRSDNDGPGSLIQIGPHGYQPPHALAAPLPLAHPVKAIEAYDLAPVPLPYVNSKPIVIEDAEEDAENSDDDSNEGGDSGFIGHGHEGGGGGSYGEEHHNAHGEKGSKGYSTKGYHAKGTAGDYGKVHKQGFYHEDEGAKKAHHDEADAHGEHHESGKGYKGGDHGHKKHFSKGEDVSGYHKVFNKDEFKKDHDFYDVADNGGHFKKHGFQKVYHGSEKGAHEKGGHSDAGHNKGGYGKSGFHNKGHLDEADEGHSAEEGDESHYDNHKGYGEKGGSNHEKEYAYGDGGADDDDEHDDK